MKKLLTLVLLLVARSAFATTWYVRPDGGTRYSVNVPTGQCDGKSDAAYPGTGSNRPCAFKEPRLLWTDGTYTTSTSSGSPTWGWIGAGGDTYILRGSIGTGVAYPVGQNGPNPGDSFGLAGNPYGAGAPAPLSGTAAGHTRILGENFAACHQASARTQLYGRFGLNAVLRMNGTSYVDVACLDITDHSDCGVQGQQNGCNTNSGTISDFAKNGISWSNTSTNDTITDVRIHGLGSAGMIGPTGNGVVMKYVDTIGNASSGWNADDASGTSGTGSLLVQNFNISWNGCAEEYPIVHALPYNDCTDDNGGGYGDGFGTATLQSNPAWTAAFDQGIVSYNTQDGLDALHLSGAGSSMTITNVHAFSNMGQQIKIGGASGDAENNFITGNCEAMRQSIPGTPLGFNAHLSDFCRAADTTTVLTVNNNRKLIYKNNLTYSASHTGIEIECDPQGGGACDTRSTIDFEQNIFLGFKNSPTNGYPDPYGEGTANSPDTYDYANPIYNGTATNPFLNVGSVYDRNVTYHGRTGVPCPANGETNGSCADPQLPNEVWPLYGEVAVAAPPPPPPPPPGQMSCTISCSTLFPATHLTCNISCTPVAR